MRKILLAISFTAALTSQASADWTGKDASATTITFKNATGACTSVACVPQAAITDSTGATFVAVKAASTAAAAADPSLVVNQSPNSQMSVAIGATGDTANAATVVGQLKQIQTNTGSATPAGANTIGNTIPAPTSSAALALTKVTCGSAVSSCILKAAAGNFYGAYAECTSACWLMIFNATSAPVDGATTAGTASGNLVDCVDVSAGSSRSINLPIFPVNYSVGITAVISSTPCATKTASAVGFITGTVQ